jgi:tRNA(fMet)-specific endonuclease VapC
VTYALDTDTFSLLVMGQAKVTARHAAAVTAAGDEVTIPAVVRAQVLRGRFDALRAAATGAELVTAYDRLVRTEAALSAYRLLPVSRAAADEFDRRRTNKKLKKIGREDLLIACIALANDATLVTRNTKDFAPVPGLKVENWAD